MLIELGHGILLRSTNVIRPLEMFTGSKSSYDCGLTDLTSDCISGQGYETYVSDWTKLLTNGTGSYVSPSCVLGS